MDNQNDENGSNDKLFPPADGDNIIRLPTARERAGHTETQEKQWQNQFKEQNRPPKEPLINLPPVTKALALVFLGIHALMSLLDPVQRYEIIDTFGFVPALYSGDHALNWPAFIGPVTYMLLHGSWAHVLINTVMLAAFGSGMERWIGSRKMLILFVGSSLCAALVHLLFNLGSPEPVIGASGGISGLFGAALLILNQRGAMGGPANKQRIVTLVVVWILISVLFGFIGAPGGGTVAWIAHIGGFLAGIALLKPVMRLRL
ncbi:MAG: rhomboid family intramembrane serine protease [Rhodospirillales bacterium]|nr:rhomboid family intramembrane serine protease [Rhodospirillales bacterium]